MSEMAGSAPGSPSSLRQLLREWMGTFLVAAAASPKNRRNWAVVAPVFLATYAAVARKAKGQMLAPGLAAAAFTWPLANEESMRHLNNVLWLRVLNLLWGVSSLTQVTLSVHLAVATTFYGVTTRPDLSQGFIVKMTRAFMPRNFFDETGRKSLNDTPRPDLSPYDTFARAWRGLFAYNFTLHFAAVLVNYFVRRLGKNAPSLRIDAFKDAFKEALALNLAVASSCALWTWGARVQGDLLGLSLAPLPVWALNPRVRNTVFFLFVPWMVRFLANIAPPVPPMATSTVALAVLEGPLSRYQTNSYAWLVSIAFGLAQRLASALLHYNKNSG